MSHSLFNGSIKGNDRLRHTLRLMGCSADDEGPNRELAARLLAFAEHEAYKILCLAIRKAMLPESLERMSEAMKTTGEIRLG